MRTLDFESGEHYKFTLINKEQNEIVVKGQVVSVKKQCDGEEIVFLYENQHFNYCVFGLNIAAHNKSRIIDAIQL